MIPSEYRFEYPDSQSSVMKFQTVFFLLC